MDVFACKYEYLITYDTSIIQHKIPPKPGVKPLKQKLRKINPYLITHTRKRNKEVIR